ncbi:DUF4083 domain-containing protein [Pseudalkalibacillus decolorationis]|uniref:DUF4083 domain-containing protein n=1 Tax=Pseudalkalibacillus decolorationis TaxID=163879 RepID=UPI002148AFB0|nr:DUF4083 domain-containing protein [Pseudalkalibacillus decolorationis]
MNIGDVVFQLISFLVLIGIVSAIVWFVMNQRKKTRHLEEIDAKLDRLTREKQNN